MPRDPAVYIRDMKTLRGAGDGEGDTGDDRGVRRRLSFALLYALGSGLLLGQAVSLQPLWWLAWIAPAFLLALGERVPSRWRLGLVMVAAVTATSTVFPALRPVMPLPLALLVVVLLAAAWALIVGETVRLRRRFAGVAWTVLGLPVFAVALDTAMAHTLPDGNWNGLAYTQADVLPVAQLAAVLGVPGILFVLMLVPATLCHVASAGLRRRDTRILVAIVLALVFATLAHGTLRLRSPRSLAGEEVRIGLAAIDEAIGREARAPYVARIRDAYAVHVATLAAGGASLVVLPEKIAVVSPETAREWDAWFAGLASRHGVSLVGSISVAESVGTRNLAWLYGPDGVRDAEYQKQHLAPVERQYVAGRQHVVRRIGGLDYALAICKDMHFASFAREYGGRGVAAALVPAWDFSVDADLARRMTLLRGIENGYAIVRPARDGQLSVNDALGRPLALARSTPLPGTNLLASVRLSPGTPTLQTRVGDALGWLCVAVAIAFAVASRRPPKHQ